MWLSEPSSQATGLHRETSGAVLVLVLKTEDLPPWWSLCNGLLCLKMMFLLGKCSKLGGLADAPL